MVNGNDEYKTLLPLLECLLERMEHLADFKLIAGANISITDTGEGVLVEAKPQILPERLRQWLLEADQKLSMIRPLVQGNAVQIEDNSLEYKLSAEKAGSDFINDENKTEMGSEEIFFPFKAVRLKESGEENAFLIRILGYNADEGRYCANTVYAGAGLSTTVSEATFSCAGSRFIWLLVTASGSSSISAELRSGENLPSQSETQYIVPIAYLNVVNGALKIVQLHFGHVHVAGRIV